MSYSSVRTDEQHGTHPHIYPNTGEVIISVTPVWDSAMNNTRWFICYGHPYQPPTSYNNESQLQGHINSQQYLINDLQRTNDEYVKYSAALQNFIQKNDLWETFERTLEEERIKRELATSASSYGECEPCAAPPDHSGSAYIGTVSSY